MPCCPPPLPIIAALLVFFKVTNIPIFWSLLGDNYVQSDGSLYVSTPVDPLFTLLPYLMKEKSGKFVLLDQIFDEAASTVFGDCTDSVAASKQQIMNIADCQDAGSFCAYR